MKAVTFEQAKRRLRRIARGEYCAIQYEITFATRGSKVPDEVRCGVYIHGGEWHVAPTWEGAFALLKAGRDRRESNPPDPKEQPA